MEEAPATPDPDAVARLRASSRMILGLIAAVVEAAFERLGEGVMMGSMPRYLEAFGRRNARYVAKHFVSYDPRAGAASSLTALNFVSDVTDTRYDMAVARQDRAVKRLHECEFEAAFADRPPFVRAMCCLLHLSTYRGAVNGLLDDAEEGYDVELEGRILFGDPHCDFDVRSRAAAPSEDDAGGVVRRAPGEHERADLAHHFYAAILTAFIEYLAEVLPPDDVESLLRRCAASVGPRLPAALGVEGEGPEAAARVVRRALALPPSALLPGGDAARCPYADVLRTDIRKHAEDHGALVRRLFCTACSSTLQAAAQAVAPGTRVLMEECLRDGAQDCRLRIEAPDGRDAGPRETKRDGRARKKAGGGHDDE